MNGTEEILSEKAGIKVGTLLHSWAIGMNAAIHGQDTSSLTGFIHSKRQEDSKNECQICIYVKSMK